MAACMCVFVCVGVRKISHLREEERAGKQSVCVCVSGFNDFSCSSSGLCLLWEEAEGGREEGSGGEVQTRCH